MRIEDKKYVWWGLLGIGVAAFFYFLSQRKSQPEVSPIQVPYLVPSSAASPSAGPSLNDQSNIIGSTPNSTVPNFSNPSPTSANYAEAPDTWSLLPNLHAQYPLGQNNQAFTGGNPGALIPNATSGWNLPNTQIGYGPPL